MTLYVTRHGETTYNEQGRYTGSTDAPLNEKGEAQARDLAERMSGTRLDAVVASPLSRARRTADIVCAALNMGYVTYPELSERNIGVYEGLTHEEFKQRYPDAWMRLSSRDPDDAPDGGETTRAFDERVAVGMEKLRIEFGGKDVLLICHGYTSSIINRQLMGLDLITCIRLH